jgi:hypothetical protein
MPDVSIVINSFRTRNLLRQCLKALFDMPPQRSFEVVVVDNDSRDGTAEMVREQFPQVRLIVSDRNRGCTGGSNLGLVAARGGHVMIMNSDIIVRPGSIDALSSFLDGHPDVGAVGPRLLRPNGEADESCYRFPTLGTPLYRRTPLGRLPFAKKALDRYLMADFDHQTTRDVDWLLGSSIMVRREAMNQVGLMDERIFMYFEDTDWCRRFWEAGWRVVFFPGSELVHFHDRSSAKKAWFVAPLVSTTARHHIASWLKYLIKYRGRPGLPKDVRPLRNVADSR